MATLKVSIPRDVTWTYTDVIQLVVGSENAASLAASSPAGGRVVQESPAWPDANAAPGSGGETSLGDLVMTHVHYPTDVCATLPVGVQSVDEHGNVSAVSETIVQLHDPPAGVRKVAVTPVSDGMGDSVPGAFNVAFTNSQHV